MPKNSNRMNKVNEELKKEISVVISQELNSVFLMPAFTLPPFENIYFISFNSLKNRIDHSLIRMSNY